MTQLCISAIHFNLRSLAGVCLAFQGKTPPVFLGHTVLLVSTVGGFVQGLPLQVETHLEQRAVQSLELAL